MWRLLSLLVQHVIVSIPDQWPVVSMEEHLVCYLKEGGTSTGETEVKGDGESSDGMLSTAAEPISLHELAMIWVQLVFVLIDC